MEENLSLRNVLFSNSPSNLSFQNSFVTISLDTSSAMGFLSSTQNKFIVSIYFKKGSKKSDCLQFCFARSLMALMVMKIESIEFKKHFDFRKM